MGEKKNVSSGQSNGFFVGKGVRARVFDDGSAYVTVHLPINIFILTFFSVFAFSRSSEKATKDAAVPSLPSNLSSLFLMLSQVLVFTLHTHTDTQTRIIQTKKQEKGGFMTTQKKKGAA